MTTGRAYKLGVSSPPAPAKGRVYKLSVAGTGPAITTGRIYKLSLAGAAGVQVNPLPAVTAESLTGVSVTASVAVASLSASSWTWRNVSGPAASISGTGATVTITTPAGLDGTTTTIGVRASNGSAQSAERLFTITTPPHLFWNATSGGWVAERPPTAL